MPSRVRVFAFGLLLLCLSALGAASAAAQWIWLPRDRNLSVTLEVAKPSLERFDQEFLSQVVSLSPRVPLSPSVWLVGEVPFARMKAIDREFLYLPYDYYPYAASIDCSSIGNPYLGVETHAASGPIFGEFGIRLPLAQRDEGYALQLGMSSDVARWEAFWPEAVSIEPALDLREVTGFNIAYRLRLSPVLVVPTNAPGADAEVYAVYAWQIGYEGRYARVGTAISGRALLTEDYGNLGQRSTNQLEVHADFGAWPVRPGLNVRVPLGSAAVAVPVVLGVSLSYVR